MKKPDAKILAIGALAGLTATLLVLGAVSQPSFSAILYAASALPILIAGLGWGNAASISAIVVSALLGAVTINPGFAVSMVFVTLAPAGWISHLASLGRPASELGGPANLTAWYPLSDIMLHLCGLVCLAIVIVGIMIGFGPDLTDRMVDALMEALKNQGSEVPDAESVQQAKRVTLLVLPMIQAAIWVVMLFSAYYVATRIVAASGTAARPREDIPSSLRMNRNAIFVFLLSLCACFFSGVIAMVGAAVLGAFGAGFLLAGFAALHYRTRGKDWRLPALILCYLASLLVLPMFFILALGLSDVRKAIALSPSREGDTPR